MSFMQETAQRYRGHAEELRAIAASEHVGHSKEILLKVAADYERMANDLEAIEATHRSVLH